MFFILLASVIVLLEKSKELSSCEVPTEPLEGFTVCKALPRYTQYISSVPLTNAAERVSVVPLAVYAFPDPGSWITLLITSLISFSLVTELFRVYAVCELTIVNTCFSKLIKLLAGSLPI